jgi:hypothetical protein
MSLVGYKQPKLMAQRKLPLFGGKPEIICSHPQEKALFRVAVLPL